MTVTTKNIQDRKGKEPIVVLTAYDAFCAKILDQAGVDILLVGDSVGMVLLGHPSTLPVTMEDMIHHTRAVRRARPSAMVVADMPFLSCQTGTRDAVYNAGRLLREGGADAVKVEGAGSVLASVAAILEAGIPVMGHLGMRPQQALKVGGYRVQGRGQDAGPMQADAKRLQDAGVFALVLECVPWTLAKEITASLSIPTIGIGAGKHCDGQVLVLPDLLGLTDMPKPKFVKRYADLADPMRKAVAQFVADVREGKYPGKEHSYEP